MTELENHYDAERVESRIRAKWDENNTYEKIKQMNKGGEDFYFLDGPPFTSGRMHCGTAWGKILKDSFLRYYRMSGYRVLDRPGYDTHGLPIEVKVEQENEFETKQDIVDYGVENFVQDCKQYARKQKSLMDEEFKDMGIWMDWDNPYLTMNLEYMDAVWSAFYSLYHKGFVDRGFDVLNTCPRCETTLSDSELEYENRTVQAAYIKFPLSNMNGSIVAWTTTPWTVTGHQFVAVDDNISYACIESEDSEDTYYVAKECIDNFVEQLDWDSYNVVNVVSGEKIVGEEYEHPLNNEMNSLPREDFQIECADYVKAEKTGFVHSAPGFGHEDYERGQELGMHPYSPVNANGKFSDKLPNYSGMYVHTAGSKKVIQDLSQNGNLVSTESYTHEYPECPRCDTDVVFQATNQWFFMSTKIKKGLESAIDETMWYPQNARDERFRNTVENAPDWNISRQRYWGTPIPVWVCEDCNNDNIVRSSEDLEQRAKEDVEIDDLHRPSVDSLVIECSQCGGDSNRVKDVLDVWFDSSVASWGSLQSKISDGEEPKEWPSDLVIEGQDQTRGWFLMQLYLGVALSDEAPYKEVLMHGFAQLDGRPMSKSRGHVLRPTDVIEEHGRDSLRAYMLSNEEQESDINMTSEMQGVESMNKKLDVVWNVYRFANMYMEEDGYVAKRGVQYNENDRNILDNWVLSRLQAVSEKVTKAFNNREPSEGLSAILNFLVNDVSRYYIKTIRDRVWISEDIEDKKTAYDTLSTVLYNSTRLLSPFTPYLSERLYESLPLRESEFSVHSEDWADLNDLYSEDLEDQIDLVRDIEETVSRLRQQEGRKQRWPVTDVYIETQSDQISDLDIASDLIKQRTNAYNINFVNEYQNIEEVVVPDMSKLGPSFGSSAHKIADIVRDKKASKLPITASFNGKEYTIDSSMVDTREQVPERVEYSSFSEGRVFVRFEVTESVKIDGYTRDIIRRCQQMRSEMNLEMEEKIYFSYKTDSEYIKKALEENRAYFEKEVRVEDFARKEDSYGKDYVVNGQDVHLEMKPKNN